MKFKFCYDHDEHNDFDNYLEIPILKVNVNSSFDAMKLKDVIISSKKKHSKIKSWCINISAHIK